jgi:hypothetical protein
MQWKIGKILCNTNRSILKAISTVGKHQIFSKWFCMISWCMRTAGAPTLTNEKKERFVHIVKCAIAHAYCIHICMQLIAESCKNKNCNGYWIVGCPLLWFFLLTPRCEAPL